ncbi:hypothetical protein J5N97_025716 [Dioscorea zingiberensis]|uniref:HSF-type DNA-binding domain-containing protein n=1 Tax=Dioscorea zingiberensis TaxID=325984 RepID=A0A9D5H604_9LILI|nr:hypothetical protein J5N97_025716 [Dioscorea zingiberensis]
MLQTETLNLKVIQFLKIQEPAAFLFLASFHPSLRVSDTAISSKSLRRRDTVREPVTPTLSDRDPTARSSSRTTSSSASPSPATTGPRGTTLRALNSSTQFLLLFRRRLRTVIACKGFRKVDPDRWEFANEEFLGGQKHLLKNIKRRRNVGQSSQQQQVSGPCVEVGQFGLETEVDRLRRDRNVLLLEVLKLRQQQHNSRAQLVVMEERLQGTERKQQQTMTFLARALKNPMFIQQLVTCCEQKKQLASPGKKRRLPANPSFDRLEEAGELVAETEMETLLSTMDNQGNSSSSTDQTNNIGVEYSEQNIGSVSDAIWEELLNEGMLVGDEEGEGDQSEIDVEVEELAMKGGDWGEDVQDLVEQMGYLDSKP